MWVVNNNKERVKAYIKSDIESNITNATDASNRIQDILAAISRATAGAATGVDQQMIGNCQRALQEISTALQNYNICRGYANQLETKEWVDDE